MWTTEHRERSQIQASGSALLMAAACFLYLPSTLSGQIVQGHLTDAGTEIAMNGANVALRDSEGTVVARTVSNYLGAFLITAPGAGRYSLLFEAIGYHSTESTSFELREGETTTIDFSLRPDPMQLDSLAVEAERQRIIPNLERQGYYQRLNEGFGQFITPEEIEERNPRYFADLLREVPGLSVDRSGTIRRWPQRCRGVKPRIWIDGIMVDAAAGEGKINLETKVSIDEVAAIEVYMGAARVPLQYGGIEGQCVMLIWTKG
jgi:hypothetical protein